MSILREEIFLDKLKADLRIEKAKLKAKKDNSYMLEGGNSDYQIELSNAAITEIESMINELKEKA